MLLLGEAYSMTDRGLLGAVYLEGEKVRDLGDEATLRARYPVAHRVRVQRITPGLADAHVHPLYWGASLGQLDLHGVDDPLIAAERVHLAAAGLPPDHWVIGHGYLFESRPDRILLEQAAPQHPVFLTCRDLHSAWVNRRALELAGLWSEAASFEDPQILRGTDGAPNGYLLEHAVELMRAVTPRPGPAELRRGLLDLAARGHTSVHVMAYERAEVLTWAEALAASGELPLRLWWALPRDQWREYLPGWRGEDLEVAAVKFFADGALGSRTAWMLEPYADGSYGTPIDALEHILEEGREALLAGFGLAVHAIGSRAVTGVAQVFRQLAPLAKRLLRLEHVQHFPNGALTALEGLPVALSVQPRHSYDDAHLICRFLPGRRREAYRFHDLWASGLPLALGSDAPVVVPDPRETLRAAVLNPVNIEQTLSETQALFAHTRGAALAAGWDNYGYIDVGVRADLTLWEDNRPVARVWKGTMEALPSNPS